MSTTAAEDALVAAIRMVEQRLAEARQGSALVDHAAWARGAELVFDSPITIEDPVVRSLAVQILARLGLKPGRSSRQRGVTFVVEVPDVFLREAVIPELKRLELAYAEYSREVLRAVVLRAFGEQPAGGDHSR